MKRILTLLLFAAIHLCSFATKDEKAAYELVSRLFPTELSSQFIFKQIASSTENKDVFELESTGNKITIRGNSANSMAVGINYYLKYYCKTSVSWYSNDTIELPTARMLLHWRPRHSGNLHHATLESLPYNRSLQLSPAPVRLLLFPVSLPAYLLS